MKDGLGLEEWIDAHKVANVGHEDAHCNLPSKGPLSPMSLTIMYKLVLMQVSFMLRR